jgi:hypothetical protein
MKVRACILMALWAALLVEPGSANFSIETPYSSCAEKQTEKPSCSKSKSSCDAPVESEDDNDNNCEKDRCNPLMSCPSGNFYVFNHSQFVIASLFILKQKASLINDNRIVKQTGDCWHPPEII